MVNKRFLVLFACVVLLFVGGFYFFKKDKINHTKDKVKLSPIREKEKNDLDTLSDFLLLKLKVNAFKEDAVSFQRNGRLEFCFTGKSFKKDELLFQLDNSEFFREITSLKQALKDSLIASLPLIEQVFPKQLNKWSDYVELIRAEDVLPDFPLLYSREELRFFESKGIVLQAQQLMKLEKEVYSFFYFAPYDGSFSLKNVPKGMQVKRNQQIATISPLSKKLKLEVSVPKIKAVDFLASKKNIILTNQQEFSIALDFKQKKESKDSVVFEAVLKQSLLPFAEVGERYDLKIVKEE